MKFFHHWVITSIQWMVQRWVVWVHFGFKDLGKHVHSCYKNLISKKFILQIGHFVLSLTSLSLSLSLITIFAFCCWPVIVCCFLVTSCHLVWGGEGHTHPIGCVRMNIVLPFDNNTNCQTQGRTSFGPRRMLSVPCPLKVYSLVREIRCVSHHGLAIYIKKYLQAKEEELWKLKYISPCKNIIFKKSSKRNQNPSRYY